VRKLHRYSIFLTKRALRQLIKLDNKTKNRILQTLEILKNYGFSSQLDIKKLKGFKKYYRIRIGNYRILFELQKPSTIIVYAILHRKSAYKH